MKKEKPAYCSVGGQGIIEGVMMRAPLDSAIAVRKENGEIATKEWKNKVRTNKFIKWPVIRGVVNFVDMMVQGVGTITDGAKMLDETNTDEYDPNKFEKFVAKKTGKNAMDVMMVFAVVLALALGIGLFFILPTFLTGIIKGSIQSSVVINLIDGGVRLAIFLGYMILVGQLKDIKRVFMYHGAEHKTIACYEAGEELTPENAKKFRRLHPRCGTSYLLLVMIVAIIVYSFLGWTDNVLWRFASRILLLPLIAGLAYEVLKLAAKYEVLFFRIIRWPGLQLQRLTTKEPDESMLEIAIIAFQMALKEKSEDEIKALIEKYDRSEKPEPVPEGEPEDEGEPEESAGDEAETAEADGQQGETATA